MSPSTIAEQSKMSELSRFFDQGQKLVGKPTFQPFFCKSKQMIFVFNFDLNAVFIVNASGQ